MYKIIVCDDERSILERLISLINKLSDDFEVIGSYENGYDALINGISLEPDILITDIKMPYIDGINLIEQAKIELPLLQSIIISGYDSFDYAKKGIELGVNGYISKPITFEELKEVLLKTKEKLNQETKGLNNLKQQLDTSNKIIIENDLIRLIALKNVPLTFKDKLINEGVNVDLKYQFILIFDNDLELDNLSLEENDLIKMFELNYFQEEFKQIEFHNFIYDNQLCFLLLSNENIFIEDIVKKLNTILAKLRRNKDINHNSISIGISDIQENNKINYRKMFRHAKRALEYRTVVGKNLVLLFEDVTKNENDKVGKIDENEYKILTYELSYGRTEQTKKRVENLISSILSNDYINSYLFILGNIIDSLLKACLSLKTFYQEYMSQIELMKRVYNSKSQQSLISLFNEIIDEINKINQSSRLSSVDNTFNQIMNYIDSNYTNPTLSLDDIANSLHYSVSYIYNILKKNNISFNKYLTSIRMEKAKVLLLDPNNKIINIASQVGYSDPYYFSHCFKKAFKVSPVEYRKKD